MASEAAAPKTDDRHAAESALGGARGFDRLRDRAAEIVVGQRLRRRFRRRIAIKQPLCAVDRRAVKEKAMATIGCFSDPMNTEETARRFDVVEPRLPQTGEDKGQDRQRGETSCLAALQQHHGHQNNSERSETAGRPTPAAGRRRRPSRRPQQRRSEVPAPLRSIDAASHPSRCPAEREPLPRSESGTRRCARRYGAQSARRISRQQRLPAIRTDRTR